MRNREGEGDGILRKIGEGLGQEANHGGLHGSLRRNGEGEDGGAGRSPGRDWVCD